MIIFKMKNINSGIYNVGTGKPEKIKKIINLIIKFTKKGNPQFGKLKMRKDEIIRSYPSINKIVKEFKWRPIVNINSGLIKTIRFYSGLNTNKYTYK
jgi:nucleoside-diphosphate-sugar epimerase